jgi:hypothetical protein
MASRPINELQTGGATAAEEWVEILNPCTAAVPVSAGSLLRAGQVHLLLRHCTRFQLLHRILLVRLRLAHFQLTPVGIAPG